MSQQVDFSAVQNVVVVAQSAGVQTVAQAAVAVRGDVKDAGRASFGGGCMRF